MSDESAAGAVETPAPAAASAGAVAKTAASDEDGVMVDETDTGVDTETAAGVIEDPAADRSASEPDAEIGANDASGAGGEYRMAIVSSVTLDLPTQHPSVVLRETESPRRQLTFSVGLQDGIALSHALRRVPTPRPLTHELMGDVLAGFDIDVVAVRLVGRQGAIYFAELDLRGRNARSVHSCRPTDALTVALRQAVPVPILIDVRLFETRGDVEPPGVTG